MAVSPESIVRAVALGAEVSELRVGALTVSWRGDGRWAVVDGSLVLNVDGEFECEPRPSSRDAAFIARTRFPFDEAVDRALAAGGPTR